MNGAYCYFVGAIILSVSIGAEFQPTYGFLFLGGTTMLAGIGSYIGKE